MELNVGVNGVTKIGLYRDKGKWAVRWHGDIDPETETAKRHCESFRLKRDAERYRAQLEAEFSKGKRRDPPPDITVGEFQIRYLERRDHEWRTKTQRAVSVTGERLQGHFGKRCKLSSITPEMATKFWSEVRSLRSDRIGEVLSRSSRNAILRYAKTMFEYAVRWGYLSVNPFATVKALRVGRRDRKEWRCMQTHEYLHLLDAAPDLRFKSFYALGYTTRARCGELLNLREDDIDFSRAILQIRNRKANKNLWPFNIKDYERRDIPIPKHTLSIVADWLRVRPGGSPFVLLTPERYRRVLARWRHHQCEGIPWLQEFVANNLVRDLRVHAGRAGIEGAEKLTIHTLRKSCATNWATHLPMHVVKELLGHSDISTTAEYYVTVDDSMADKARWVVDAMLGAAATESRSRPNEVRVTG